jgi:hypothetical protein
MYRIKRLNVMSVARVAGVCYAALGLVIIVPFMLIMSSVAATIGGRSGVPNMAGGFASVLVMAIIMPIIYGVIGAIFAALGAVVYNVIAGWLGGIEMEFELVGGPPVAPTAPYPVVPHQ